MADNIIKVTVSSSTKKNVSVSSANVGTEITASSDTGRFWAQTSKNWAVSDNIVDNTDYSSKYYANKAKESANIAQSNAEVCGDIYNSVQEVSQTVFQNIDIKSQEAVTNINNAKTEAVDSSNSTKSTAISDIEFVVDGEKQEIQGLVDDEKDEIKDLANLIKENAQDIASRTSFAMFDTVLKDHILTYEESKGLALQGTYVYKEALAGSYYGYPDFYNKCLEEKEAGIATEVTLGETTITMYVNSNGHQFYDITDKEAVDTWFNTYGYAWFYGVDSENERILLPRNNYFAIKGCVDSVAVDVYGSGLGLSFTNGTNNFGSIQYNDKTYGLLFSGPAYGKNVGYNAGQADKYSPSYTVVGITPDPTKSGLTGKADTSNVIQFDDAKYLYICVGNTVNYECMTEVVNQGMDILEQVNQGIESRVNLDATNLSDTGKSIISSFGMPSDRYIDLTLGATNSTYSAPANGYVLFTGQGGGYVSLTQGAITAYNAFDVNSNYYSVLLPVVKGEFKANYSGITNRGFRFIYAVGSESEA